MDASIQMDGGRLMVLWSKNRKKITPQSALGMADLKFGVNFKFHAIFDGKYWGYYGISNFEFFHNRVEFGQFNFNLPTYAVV